MFPDDLAEILKSRAGQKYQPSNGTEGDIFYSQFCEGCRREANYNPDEGTGGCDILLRAYWCDIDEPDYPSEWQYAKDGQPMCTAFQPHAEEWEAEFAEAAEYRKGEKGQGRLFE